MKANKLKLVATAMMVTALTSSIPAIASAQAEELPPPPIAVEANGSMIAPPPTGFGQVVFYRKSGFGGAAIIYKVREGTRAYGTLSNGKYFVVVTEPGPHTYVVHSEAKDELTLEVEAGETYFVEGTVTMGILAGRPNLTPSTEEAFAAIAHKLKLAKPES